MRKVSRPIEVDYNGQRAWYFTIQKDNTPVCEVYHFGTFESAVAASKKEPDENQRWEINR